MRAGERLWLGVCAFVAALLLARPAIADLVERVQAEVVQGTMTVRVDFIVPVQYLSHFPQGKGRELTINLRLDENADGPDEASQIPNSQAGPLSHGAYVREGDQLRLVLSFRDEVRYRVVAEARAIVVLFPDITAQQAKTPEAASPSLAARLMTEARKALTAGDNPRAIQLLTKLLELNDPGVGQDALELLGLARERNGQAAHAKAIYEDYLQRYPEDEGARRVRQRLAALGGQPMREPIKLKAATRDVAAPSSTWSGSVYQYFYRNGNYFDGVDEVQNQSLLISQFVVDGAQHRGGYNFRHYFYGSHSYSDPQEDNANVTIERLYTGLDREGAGFSARLGRQPGTTGGVFGRFDGLAMGYDLAPTISANAMAGYPVDLSRKDTIATDKPFAGVNFVFSRPSINLDVSPYVIGQYADGVADRIAIGNELRYFHPTRGNIFSLVDYDVLFNDLNVLLLRGQYSPRPGTAFSFNMDYRNSPLLQTSNALINEVEGTLLSNLVSTQGESVVRELARRRTGRAIVASVGVSQQLSAKVQLNADVTRSDQNYTAELDGADIEQADSLMYYSLQGVFSQLIGWRDTTLVGLRLTQSDRYDNRSLILTHRIAPRRGWLVDIRLRTDWRDSAGGELLLKKIALLKLSHRWTRRLQFMTELGGEWWDYNGKTNNPDYRQLLWNAGYTWSF